jgi:amidase
MDAFTPASQLAAAIRSRRLSPVDLLETCLSRVDQVNPAVNAVIWRNDDEARAVAKQWEEIVVGGHEPLPPFAGVPIPVKDLTRVEGWPVTFGSRGARSEPSRRSELVVQALVRAGFVLCGRTNTPELGPLPVSENLRYGITRNPWDTTLTAGGSSGGAAAAVAAGMFPIAHGNDGGGSLRIPASCCGLVGLKPSRGRVPSLAAGWLGAATEGAVCRSVEDCAAVLDVISKPDAAAWFQAPRPAQPFQETLHAPRERLRVGVLVDAPLGTHVEPAPLAAVEHAASLLSAAGHHVEKATTVSVPVEVLGWFVTVMNTGSVEYPEVDYDNLEPYTAEQRRQAQAIDSLFLADALRHLQLMSRDVIASWGRDFDVMLTPTMATEPPPAGTVLEAAHAQPGGPPAEVLSMSIFSAAFNITGQPAVNLPLHWTRSGLPIGVQLVGAPYDEATLLQLGSQLEEMAPWVDRRPPEKAIERRPEAEEAGVKPPTS